MAKLSQAQKIEKFLEDNPNLKFTAREIAENITQKYSKDYEEKRNNPRFSNDGDFIQQIVAEIGAQKDRLSKFKHIFWQDKPRPRVYWYDPHNTTEDEHYYLTEKSEINDIPSSTLDELSEHNLYPLLIEYLNSELNLKCKRIDEKRSSNSRGSGGNQWLHPDIVAMETIDVSWNKLVKSCLSKGAGQRVRLWSFEVKKELSVANVRTSFFQAVSNSSWANEGYLVATSISNIKVERELRMLSALHGIGVILLNPDNPSESDILLPAQAKLEIDWQSVNRILSENKDFEDYIELVATYYETGRTKPKDWDCTTAENG